MMHNNTRQEILFLEDRLKDAELAHHPEFFETYLDDHMIMVSNGEASSPKQQIIKAHQPDQGTKFTRVVMTDMKIIDHGDSAVVTCKGTYEGPRGVQDLKFMRVWVRKPEGWRIVAGTIS